MKGHRLDRVKEDKPLLSNNKEKEMIILLMMIIQEDLEKD